MTDPLIPATLAFRDDGTLFSPAYDDIYHSAVGALAQAHHVFIAGNGLPQRWRERRVFTIVETGFGAGGNFLATWAAWRADPTRCERLHFVSIEKHPFSQLDLRAVHGRIVADATISPLAQQLGDAWPMLVPGMHRLEFEGGRVTLTLAFGDALELLPKLWLRADAFYLDGFSPAKNPDMWSLPVFKSLARLAGDGATFATYTSAGDVKRSLEQAGFSYKKVEGFGWKRAMLVGEFAPRWRVRRHEPPMPLTVGERHAIVIGAGLAGCSLTERLAARGWRISLIDRHAAAAREASGNPAGVFHPLISRDDSVASRITRAGFLYALRRWSALEQRGYAFQRSTLGLLHLAIDADETRAMTDAIISLGYPADFVTPASQTDAQALANVALTGGGWLYPRGGSLDPGALCQAQCEAAGDLLTRHFGVEVQRIERVDDRWCVIDAAGRPVASASVVIFANACDAARVAGLHQAPTRIVRGQLTLLPAGVASDLRVPLIGEGYAVPLAHGITLTGATYEVDDADRAMRAPGHLENLERLAQLMPDVADELTATDPGMLEGRVAFRCVTSDRLPMAGALADEGAASRDAAALRGAWPLDLPRADGLYGAFAYGSRGLVWATLAAELIASQIEGEPWPIERDLAESIDPARYLLRALRHGALD
ncbi:bifunctional tRNA (5-methylaminomethyl-2-thiouridine)(34)-methyltransferase MnmD/FAD-dependent 5-carboxymethylaminomethyl-2-thiouridine(34) oxidoreductase MnmC [Trinickia violacea]|uniref:tRNA 5-methylaminomethyl-2-thiouridine biosynthesis bifunctional protein MnmC n=1 Tax=Trinickia violacea TaxID=2571746 RepID=A0A4V1EHV1_9BURK|nr:bifunctional tRNA (5-methylaminomethyl-2-thiouridine)(34)-methyltransferase MnmD/FAD-dependent 5-carboxymethylaminomethyl-2-thiouridine(34) oxidoreductase MnmC [Trinickia violacea]QCP51550.1 bifunctional tRNA (5-methylaminomethyl-2-thiouridine)(34)-methyltransferase MnmD/FAD-dependent 5-carboxymethylaminomethyl-2-thiouridine(34) oxidoreductase MnmC [Trinickia violacea]